MRPSGQRFKETRLDTHVRSRVDTDDLSGPVTSVH